MKMRARGLGVVLVAAVLAGCSHPDMVLSPTNNQMVWDAKDLINRSLSSSMLNRSTPGAYVKPTTGAFFKPVEPIDSRNAIVYVYRPHDDWNADELQAPSFFVNGQRVYGLKDNGYFWLELPAGHYFFMAKRPISLLHVKTVFDTELDVVGGKAYYFRYDESDKFPKPKEDAGLLHVGPLQQVVAETAMPEIKQTRLEDPGQYFDYEREPIWKPFDLYPHDTNVQYGKLEISDPDKGVHERYAPGADTSKVQNDIDRETHFLPDWLRHIFR